MKSNSFMRNRKAFTTVLLFCTGFIASHPLVVSAADKVMAVQLIHQQQTIKGIVVDASGEPVIGANVVVEGTTMGTITDFEGTFSISVPKNGKIKISFIGYKDQVLTPQSGKNLRVVLEDDSQMLGEVQVVAYGAQKKVSITGAISSMKGEDLLKTPAASMSNVLSGQITGISSVQYSGEPGADEADLYVRGIATWNNAKPLIQVDGVEREFSQIDPNEVESITVLKDASATAVFGVRGANGVILITTKRGAEGKAKISFSTSAGVNLRTKQLEFANSYQYASYYNDLQVNDGGVPTFTEEQLIKFRDHTDPILYPDINWIDYCMNKAAFQSQHNVNISGGTDRMRYFVSAGMFTQDGMFKQLAASDNFNFNYKRYNYRANLDFDATKTTLISVNIGGRIETKRTPESGEDQNQLFRKLYWAVPFAGAGIVDGKRVVSNADYLPFTGSDGLNSYYGKGFRSTTTNVLNVDLVLDQKLDFITKGLSAQVYFSFESNNYQHTTRLQSFDSFWYKGKDATGEAIYQPHSVKSRLSTTDSRWVERYTYLDVRLNYDRTFAEKHQISAQLLGNRTLRSQNAELPYAYQGISSRIAYNFDTRYYLEANIGYNGSENFPPKKRYGFFPSFSAGWVLSDEKFISLPSWIQLIKLRGSYGTVGNDKIGGQRWLYITEFTPGGTAMGTYQFGVSPQSVAGYNESRVGNKFVTWEKSAKGNVGFDLSLFKDNAVQFTFDYFWEKRNNILTTPGDVPDYVGITNVAPRNSGKVENKGIEAELRFNKRINKDLSIFANLQMTYARNKVLENDEPIPAFDYQDLRGYEIGYVLGYKSAGLFQDEEDIRNSPTQSFGTVVPGDIKYVDTNKDGVIDAFDRVPIKVNNVPRSMSGLSLGVTYKNFDFSMLMNASTGGTAYLYTYPSSKINLERWTAENKNARIPAAHSTTNNTVVTDHFVQNTDYIKLRNVEIGYTLPKKFLSSLRISTARIYLNGQNLAVWDKMWLKDRDPESAGGAALAYPLQRVFNIGIHVEL